MYLRGGDYHLLRWAFTFHPHERTLWRVLSSMATKSLFLHQRLRKEKKFRPKNWSDQPTAL